ncbi:hypothetical protein A2U01_0066940, partial [Trifolium medium]|nr:hypothetical protein [Trifolium medium]
SAERGRGTGIFLVEGDCEYPGRSRRDRGRVVSGECREAGGRWSCDFLLD